VGGSCCVLGVCRFRRPGKAATYAHTRTAIASIITELPGERAEALFIAMAALVPTAGEQFPVLMLRALPPPSEQV
jgi:hypothetical protein